MIVPLRFQNKLAIATDLLRIEGIVVVSRNKSRLKSGMMYANSQTLHGSFKQIRIC